MTNSDQGDAITEPLLATAAELYDWPARKVEHRVWQSLGDEEQARYTGVYLLTLGGVTYRLEVKPVVKSGVGNALLLSGDDITDDVFYLQKTEDKTAYFFANTGQPLHFEIDANGLTELHVFDSVLQQAQA